jgi:hypothetical protein
MCTADCYVCKAVDQQTLNVVNAPEPCTDVVLPIVYRKLPKKLRGRIINPR